MVLEYSIQISSSWITKTKHSIIKFSPLNSLVIAKYFLTAFSWSLEYRRINWNCALRYVIFIICHIKQKVGGLFWRHRSFHSKAALLVITALRNCIELPLTGNWGARRAVRLNSIWGRSRGEKRRAEEGQAEVQWVCVNENDIFSLQYPHPSHSSPVSLWVVSKDELAFSSILYILAIGAPSTIFSSSAPRKFFIPQINYFLLRSIDHTAWI